MAFRMRGCNLKWDDPRVIRAEGSVVIERPPREVLEFVLDLDRYRQADTKIINVSQQPTLSPSKPQGRARYRGRLRGLPTPSQWQTVSLIPWERVDIRTEPGQWTAVMATFIGGFRCDPLGEDGTRLTHFEQFEFRRPANWLLDPYLRGWMQRYLVNDELPRLKSLIEAT